jgi:TPR repeat protein
MSKQDYYLIGIDILKRVSKDDLEKAKKIIHGVADGYVNVKVRSTLGIIYTNENKVLQDRNNLESWYMLAEAQGYKAKKNIYNLAKKNVPEARQVLIEDAENGIAEAQLALGNMYANGNGVLKDRKEADNWYRLAEAQEHKAKTNIYNLAKKNDLQGMQVLIDDAKNGIAEAQFVLASMYAKGQGVPQNYQEAIKWYYQLAEKQGTNNEEIIFDYDWRKSNIPQALKLLTNDAEKGIANAQNNLGMIYAHGQDVLQDDKRALNWYRLAAENGSYRAKYNLGLMYAKGQGAPKDEQKAIKWFRLYLEDCRGTNKYIQPSKKECLSGI